MAKIITLKNVKSGGEAYFRESMTDRRHHDVGSHKDYLRRSTGKIAQSHRRFNSQSMNSKIGQQRSFMRRKSKKKSLGVEKLDKLRVTFKFN